MALAAMRKEWQQLGLPSERGKEACTRKTKASTITLSSEDMLMTNAQVAIKYGISESSVKRIKAKAKKGE